MTQFTHENSTLLSKQGVNKNQETLHEKGFLKHLGSEAGLLTCVVTTDDQMYIIWLVHTTTSCPHKTDEDYVRQNSVTLSQLVISYEGCVLDAN